MKNEIVYTIYVFAAFCALMFYDVSIDYGEDEGIVVYTKFDGLNWQHSHKIISDPYAHGSITADEIITTSFDGKFGQCHMTLQSWGISREPTKVWRDTTPRALASSWTYTTRVRGTDLICVNNLMPPRIEFVNTASGTSHVITIPPEVSFGWARSIRNRMFVADFVDIEIDPLLSCYKCTLRSDCPMNENYFDAIGENTIYTYWPRDGYLEMRDIRVQDPMPIGYLCPFFKWPAFLQSGHIVFCNKENTTMLVDLRMPSETYELPYNDKHTGTNCHVRFVDIDA